MKKGLSAREKAEINALVESSHQALIDTVMTLREREAKRIQAKAAAGSRKTR